MKMSVLPANSRLSSDHRKPICLSGRSSTCIAALIFLLLALLAVLGSCKRQNSDAPSDRSNIEIGFFGDLSGPTFNFGESAKNGLLMATDEINQAGGIKGRKLDVVIEDDRGMPEVAAKLAGKLIDEDKVVAI